MLASKSVRTVLAALTAVTLAGCMPRPSDEPDDHLLDPAATAATPDPCGLLTPEEVQQVRGGTIEPGEEIRGNRTGERVCSFDQQGTKLLTTVSVYPEDRAGFDGEFETVKANFPDSERVPGIGEAAFISTVFLFSIKGAFVVVVVAAGDVDAAKPKLLALGPKAVARLP
ncbi:hypothetical protein ACQEVZ_52315 [Dactylosporangium sp. CA-152071]|uniref:hypothetical protein n=1 Tax=Dactylosporangium sp. CA-152071 TaxID=3239933 RepID=UPI003D8FC5F7